MFGVALASTRFKQSLKRDPTEYAEHLLTEQELYKMPLFESFSQEFMAALGEVATTHSYHGDVEIVREKSGGSSLYLVLRGLLDVYVADTKVNTLTAGQWFGETMLLGIEESWTATLRTANACTLCEVQRKDLNDILSQYPDKERYIASIRNENRRLNLFRTGTLLNTCELFRGLSQRCLRALDGLTVRRIYFANEVIMEEGKKGDELFILANGEISTSMTGREVRRATTADLRRKSFKDFDASALLPVEERDSDSEGDFGGDSGSDAPRDAADIPACCFGELGLRKAAYSCVVLR
jgi:CRP-like cAMP-binding protein